MSLLLFFYNLPIKIKCPPRSLVSPRGWSGAGKGVGMLTIGGFPYLKKYIGFLVSKLLGFKASWFQRFLAAKLQNLKDSPNVNFMFSCQILIPYSRFSRICLTGRRYLSVYICSDIFKMFEFPKSDLQK